MPQVPVPSIEELREEFMRRGLYGINALYAAQAKYIDLNQGHDLPYELYITQFRTPQS